MGLPDNLGSTSESSVSDAYPDFPKAHQVETTANRTGFLQDNRVNTVHFQGKSDL